LDSLFPGYALKYEEIRKVLVLMMMMTVKIMASKKIAKEEKPTASSYWAL
jgi:hypothetical protein